MSRSFSLTRALCLIALIFAGNFPLSASEPGFQLPPGFVIQQIAGPEFANDIYCMTIAPTGEIVVSGRGYLKQLVDENHDGLIDRSILLADHPKDGAMGLLVDEGFLYCMGDGGLRRFPWKPGLFVPSSQLLFPLKTGGEHDAHAISRGPDRWLYLLCGNTSGVSKKHASANSPLQSVTAGCVVKISPDFKTSEILCDGLRNAYGFDWSLDGELYTYDSDNERCLGLPWYEGCRFYRIQRGGHYGWRSPQKGQFWRLPPYHTGVVVPLMDLGRGSPTGVVCYRHQQFPTEYQGSFFLLDWTFGTIHCVKLHAGRISSSTFLKTTTGNGFAPTAAAIDPVTGDLLVSTGGRGTRGAVYRIRHQHGYESLPAQAQLIKPQYNPMGATFQSVATSNVASPESLLAQFVSSDKPERQLHTLCLLMSSLGEYGASSSEYAFQEGYQFKTSIHKQTGHSFVQKVLTAIRPLFPSDNKHLNRELSRAFALLQDDSPQTLDVLLHQITASSSPIDDMHYLFVIACCPAKRTAFQRQCITHALIQLDSKYIKSNLPRERHFRLRLAEAIRALIAHDNELVVSIAQHPELGRPEHLYLVQDKRFPRQVLATIWLKKILENKEYPWSPELITLLACAPKEGMLPLMRSHWDERTLREAILPVLAQSVDQQDRLRFIEALELTSPQSILLALNALSAIPEGDTETKVKEIVSCIKALRYWYLINSNVKEALQKRLQSLTQTREAQTPQQWQAWIINRHPAVRAQLEDSDGVNRTRWNERLKRISWSDGRVERGESIFKKLCANCHQGTSALGPDLAGLNKRFKEEDLITQTEQKNPKQS